ncbi:hypothetical protein PTSG_12041 [Salpingoeca rosetta]|uniref:NmrA-like domain-containing protein n=1 Tax=Salpingoeca rosetta (strain ATCC 50818 / BSB-021) TaxID=946362 RepID=F2U607_SALR5|nr:uncharacterized protein PTSG_12041 [Salpingoeca rosetta]EGD82948.1 hypothetical protein PTSG_12041 [Salpingoeca rosetta]|eukprot:XP_004995312.1 hypothetical protein PTSG_12041 [Salpingoeca rosetta]
MADKPVVVVFTANSNTGTAVVRELAANYADDVRIRCVVRKKANAKHLQGLPIEVINADITQPALLKAVFADDVNVCFWSTPTTQDRADLTKRFVDACIEYGVDFPVIVSMLDADKRGTLHQQHFAEIEAYCEKMRGTPVKRQLLDTGKQTLAPIILRCAPFYQNMLASLAGIAEGQLYYPLGKNEGYLPHVDLKDVGKIGAKILVDPTPHGNKTYNLIGEYQQGNQLASSITRSTGHPCTYEEVDDPTAAMAFAALGLPEWLADANTELIAYFREDNGQDIKSDVEEVLGTPPTKFAAFCKREMKPFLDEL